MHEIEIVTTTRNKPYVLAELPTNYVQLVGVGSMTISGKVTKPANHPTHMTEY